MPGGGECPEEERDRRNVRKRRVPGGGARPEECPGEERGRRKYRRPVESGPAGE